MRTEVCGACKFWQATVPLGRPDDETGECRRRPPMVHPLQLPSLAGPPKIVPMSAFPVTHATSWCGEFAEGDASE